MQTIETIASVSEEGTVTITAQTPGALPRGKHRAVVVIDELPIPDSGREPGKSRWARFSEEIRANPSLSGAGDFVQQCSAELREDFALTKADLDGDESE